MGIIDVSRCDGDGHGVTDFGAAVLEFVARRKRNVREMLED
jgi:hypothetical protein